MKYQFDRDLYAKEYSRIDNWFRKHSIATVHCAAGKPELSHVAPILQMVDDFGDINPPRDMGYVHEDVAMDKTVREYLQAVGLMELTDSSIYRYHLSEWGKTVLSTWEL